MGEIIVFSKNSTGIGYLYASKWKKLGPQVTWSKINYEPIIHQNVRTAVSGVGQWIEPLPMKRKVTGSVPG